jgi:nicotinamide mononucleotide transporter PnuC
MHSDVYFFRGIAMHKIKTYFSKNDIALWSTSIIFIITSFCLFDNENYLTLSASVIGVTSLIFNAKGNPFGQFLIIIFSILYGIISYSYQYYGELITYVCLTGPSAIISLISWLKNLNGDKLEVKVNELKYKEYVFLFFLSIVVSFAFYFILKALNTTNLLLSTFSIFTSFIASYLTFRRSRFYALGYIANDIVLIVLWILASVSSKEYISVVICFVFFLINDLYGFINWTKLYKEQSNKLN